MGNAVRASTEVTPNLMAEFLIVLLIGDDYVSSASAAAKQFIYTRALAWSPARRAANIVKPQVAVGSPPPSRTRNQLLKF